MFRNVITRKLIRKFTFGVSAVAWRVKPLAMTLTARIGAQLPVLVPGFGLAQPQLLKPFGL